VAPLIRPLSSSSAQIVNYPALADGVFSLRPESPEI